MTTEPPVGSVISIETTFATGESTTSPFLLRTEAGWVVNEHDRNPRAWDSLVGELFNATMLVNTIASPLRAETEPERDEPCEKLADALADLVSSLWLYVGHHTWTQLTTDQKELFANTIEADAEEGEPVEIERWWR